MKYWNSASIFILILFSTATLLGYNKYDYASFSTIMIKEDAQMHSEDKPLSSSSNISEELLRKNHLPRPAPVDRKEYEIKTDMFMKGAFCVISFLMFVAGYIVVKTHEGVVTFPTS